MGTLRTHDGHSEDLSVKERPILFSGEMVRAILEGRKTQTRREIKPQPKVIHALHTNASITTERIFRKGDQRIHCPYGQPGDRLWVREAFTLESDEDAGNLAFKPVDGRPIKHVEGNDFYGSHNLIPHYKATDPEPSLCCESDTCRQCENNGEGPHWKPSIHMPRWASRLTLEITNVKVERLNDISEEDALAEGCFKGPASGRVFNSFIEMRLSGDQWRNCRDWFADLWESINGTGSWEKNPWVWVIEFKRVSA